MEITNEDIINYLQSIDITEENALDFYRSCITDNYDSPQGYIFRKVLSQLEVRHHIEQLDFALGQYTFGKTDQILKSSLRGETKYADKMIQLDKKSKFNFRYLDQTTLCNIIDSKSFFIEQFLFSIPCEIRTLEVEIANTPKNDDNKIIKLNDLLDLAKEKLQRAEQEVYDISFFSLPTAKRASEEWKEFIDFSIPKLRQDVSEYAEIGIKSLERKRVEKGGTIGLINNVDLNEVINQTTGGINEFLKGSVLDSNYLDNFKVDIAMQLRLIKFVYQNKNLKSLDDIIRGIREQFNTTRLSSSKISNDPNSQNYYRQNILNGKEKIWKNTAKPEKIPEMMRELNIRYNELLKLEDEKEYMREAVKLYRDFIQIHPFSDGNGRTSRYLLDYMLIQRGITPPILYDTYYDRRQLDHAMDMDINEEGKEDTLLKFVEEGLGGRRQPKVDLITETNKVNTEIDKLSFQEILDSRMRESVEKKLERQIGEQELEINYSLTSPKQRRDIIAIIKDSLKSVRNVTHDIINKFRKDSNGNSDGRG